MGRKQAPIVLLRNGEVWKPKDAREERTNLVIHIQNLIWTTLPPELAGEEFFFFFLG